MVEVLEAMQRSLERGGETVSLAAPRRDDVDGATRRRAWSSPPTPSIGAGVLFGANVTVHEGTVVGDGCAIGDNAVLGKQPGALGPLDDGRARSGGWCWARGARLGRRRALGRLELGDGCVVGDLATVRERVTVGEGVVIGRGVCIENDVAIGAFTKIQTNAYITADATLEEHVFIAPGVVTTNDNFMGRTERRHALKRGPTVRRGARVGGARCSCPGSRWARRRSSARARS